MLVHSAFDVHTQLPATHLPKPPQSASAWHTHLPSMHAPLPLQFTSEVHGCGTQYFPPVSSVPSQTKPAEHGVAASQGMAHWAKPCVMTHFRLPPQSPGEHWGDLHWPLLHA
jgi:hypothetical protein